MGLLRLLGIEKYLKKVKDYVDEKTESIPAIEGNSYLAFKDSSSSANGEYSVALGSEVTVNDDFAFATGSSTVANGYASHAEGVMTTAYEFASHAEGEKCRANGRASHAEGVETITSNEAEHAEGKYNFSYEDMTIHSVGVGNGPDDRKNAHEITYDGKNFFLGVGGYNGTNSDDSDDLAYVLENRLPDKVVWKYICNPLTIKDGDTIPYDLWDREAEVLKYLNTAMYRVAYGNELIPVWGVYENSMSAENRNVELAITIDSDRKITVDVL